MKMEGKLNKELSSDEQEILLTFNKKKSSNNKETMTGIFMTVFAFVFLMVMGGLVVHFTGIIHNSDNELAKETASMIQFADQQRSFVQIHQNVLDHKAKTPKKAGKKSEVNESEVSLSGQASMKNKRQDQEGEKELVEKSSKHKKKQVEDGLWHEGTWEPKPRTFSTEEQLNPELVDGVVEKTEDYEPGKILKPQTDPKNYKYVELENKLKVLLVSDPNSRTCQAALSVQAGSWSEPDSFPGLAHFLEHMLFQGSHTYPESGYFEKMVARGGGSTNAYTKGSETNYYFKVSSQNQEETLNVFAHFFIDPLLDESMVDKEVNAVNSEYEIDVSGDGWKLIHLMSLLSDPSHPMSRFTIGNNASLKKEGVVEALKAFHEQYYSSNLMALVIKSPKNLEEMEKWVLSSEFKKIPNKNIQKPDISSFGYPIPNKNLGSIVKYHVNSHSKTLLFAYQLDDNQKYYKTKPIDLIDSIVRSKHDGGLLQYLQKQGVAVDIDATTFMSGNGAFSYYLIEVIVADQEHQNFDEKCLDIAQAITSYFDLMVTQFFDLNKKERIQSSEMLRQIWEERQAMGAIAFRYLEDSPQNPFSNIFHLSSNLNYYPPEEVLSADFIYKDFNGQVIYEYLTHLLNPANMIVLIGDSQYKFTTEQSLLEVSYSNYKQDCKYVTKPDVNRKNDLYRLEWDQKQLSQESMDFIAQVMQTKNVQFEPVQPVEYVQKGLEDLTLPTLNSYIPKDLDLKSLCVGKKLRSEKNTEHKTAEPEVLLQDQYEHLPHDTNLEESKKYQKRLNQFLQTGHSYFYTSKEDCLKHEHQYEKENKFPQLIKKDIEGRSWWKLQRSYQIPAVFAGLSLENAVKMDNIKSTTLLRLFNEFISDKLHEKMQQSFEAGYELAFDSSNRGISMSMFGWNDKFPQFYEDILKTINSRENSDQDINRMDRVRQSMILQLENAYERKLYIQSATHFLPMMLQSNFYTPEDQIKELKNFKFDDLSNFRNEALNNFRFTSFITGNILRDEAEQLVSQIQDVFHESTSQIRIQNHEFKISNLRGKSIVVPFISKSTDIEDMNGATLNYYQIGYRDQREYTIMNFLAGAFQNQAYNYLRTDLQLGYVVSARFRPLRCIDGATIMVQGTALPPYEVDKHIENYLKKFYVNLENMSHKEFEAQKRGAISALKESIKSLNDEAQFMWEHIEYADLAFEEKEVAASLMEQITKDDVLNFYKKTFMDSEKTGKISIQIYGKGMLNKGIQVQEPNFQDFIKQQTLNKEDSAASQKELIAFNMQQFRFDITRDYVCNYKITNI